MSFKLNNGKFISSSSGDKHALLEILVKVIGKFGRPLSFEEARVCPEMPKNTNLYAAHFGSFKQACKEAQVYLANMKHPDQHTTRETRAKRAERSLDLQKERIYQSAYGSDFRFRRWKMKKRDEIMERVIQICHEHGDSASWIKDRSIKHDPILIHEEVVQAFGSVAQLRQEASRLLRQKLPQNAAELPKTDEALPEAIPESTGETDHIVQEGLRAGDVERAQVSPAETPPKQRRRGSGKRKSELALWLEIKTKYLALGRLPTDLEILADEEMSHPVTYYKRLGKGYRERFMDRMMAHESSASESQTSRSATEPTTPVQPIIESKEQVEPESNKEIQPTVEPKEEIGSVIVTKDVSTEPDTHRIPIQIIIPKGITGEITLRLSF